jgi:hypothetical protein
MNVPNITQPIGGVTTLPAQTSGTAAADSRTPIVRNPEPESSFSFTRLAWFDTNGDGHIDPRAAAAGGDATLLVGSHEVDLPTYSRTIHTVGDVRAFRAKEAGAPRSKAASTPDPTTAQTRQAIDAYQRYGEAPTPAAAAPVVTLAPATTPLVAPSADAGQSAPAPAVAVAIRAVA